MKELPSQIKFDYIKSNHFRIVHADGVFGGVTPRGGVFMTFYSERPAIPTQMVHAVTEDGHVGDEIREQRVVRDAIVREAEVGILIAEENIESLIGWLQGKLEIIKALKRDKEADAPKGTTDVATQ